MREEAHCGARAPRHEVSDIRRAAIDGTGHDEIGSGSGVITAHGAITRVRGHTHHQRQRPPGDVVQLIAKVFRPSALLLGHEIGVDGHVNVHQGANQALRRLIQVDHVAARLVGYATGGEALIGTPDLDALLHQQAGQLVRARLVCLRGNDVSPNTFATTFVDRADLVGVKIFEELRTIYGNRFRRPERCHEMIANGLAVLDGHAVVLSITQAASRPLLVGHGNAAEVRRPARAITRIQGVIDFAGEVVEAEAVEPARVGAAEELQAVALILRKMRVIGIRFRGKVIGAV